MTTLFEHARRIDRKQRRDRAATRQADKPAPRPHVGTGDHRCFRCGAFGAFGHGPPGDLTKIVWACADHKAELGS